MKPFTIDLLLLGLTECRTAEEKAWRALDLGALWRELRMRYLLREFAQRDYERYLELALG